ncbi:hypothetical protein D6D06_09056 [Aureobasidium pullulans]|nr:hypothetical protein D6D06_09056 [Aureobasidium pullulans]
MSTSGASDSVQEWLRLRALARYFAPNNITADLVNAERSEPLPPELASSPLLTAITQNGCLRMNCDRAYVSLIDSSTQYILSEATRTISIRDSTKFVDPQDTLFLGVQSLNKEYGICPQSVDIFTDRTGRRAIRSHEVVANTSRYVIRDLRQLAQYKHCPYVVGFPHFVSYAEVPVKSASGHILGTYCIMDNKIREDFFNDSTIEILNDIAACVSEQFELHAIKQESLRGVQMMRGLSEFIESRRSRRDSVGATTRRSSSNSQHSFIDYLDLPPAQSDATLSPSPLLSDKQSPNDTPMLDVTPPTSMSDLSSLPSPNIALDEVKSSSTGQPLSASQPLKAIYSGAANLIRTAMDIEGLMFLRGSAENTINDFASQPLNHGSSANPKPNSRVASSICEVLGDSIVPGGSDLGSPQQPLAINDASLNYLIRHFPRGCVFVADTQGNPIFEKEGAFIAQTYTHRTSSIAVEVSGQLQSLIRKAGSLIFLPLWDNVEDRFIVGMLGWSSNPTRVLGEQDMTCLSAFGNTFMTEIARTEMTELARAKSDFLSSISHELRSPLHGIHAAVDLLQDPQNDSKSELVEMIQSCSSTLLDTLNHVLDFSRVNKLTDDEPHPETLSCGETQELAQNAFGDYSEEYLCDLVLGVVEGLHFGQAKRKATYNKMQNTPIGQSAGPDFSLNSALLVDGANNSSSTTAGPTVAVYVDIESRADWCMMLCAGAWKRLVMNLFANALKYTNEGFIEVALKVIKHPDNPVKRTAHLMVKDTGIGMAPEFVQRSLYQPFVQENPIADGTGLGLSIVKKIIQDLQGTIDVQSTQGVGTRFDVFVPIPDCDEAKNPSPPNGGDRLDPKAILKGRSICLLSPSNKPDLNSSPAQLDLQMRRTAAMHSCVQSITRQWFGMDVMTCDKLENITADIVIAEESLIANLLATDPELSTRLDKQRLILIDANPGKKLLSNAVILPYPISPKALVRALSASLTEPQHLSLESVVVSDPMTTTPLPPTTTAFSPDLEPSLKKAKNITTIATETTAPLKEDITLAQNQQHFLLVDDNAINLRLLSTFMKKLGFSAETAVNGLEAYEKFKSTNFTTVLMDISMPVMNGFESSRAIRSHEALQGQLKPARIIALTGLGSEASKQEAKMSGIDEFHTKPVKFGALKVLLQR